MSATLASVYGRNSASIAGTLTAAVGPIVTTRNGSLEDALVSYGDLYPTLKLKRNNGLHNYMVYGAGDIPSATKIRTDWPISASVMAPSTSAAATPI